jgi:gliding motility-associated-like protein
MLNHTKTRLLFWLFILLAVSPVSLFAQKYWMERAGSSTIDEASGISLDDSNNTYTTGYFTGTASFGTFSLTDLGVSDVFVTKTNSAGIFQWAVKGGDGGSDRGLAIKTDAKGNSYVTGYYYGTAFFGAQKVTSAGSQDVFIAKYDRNGNLRWVVSGGGAEADIGNAINIDNKGDVVVTGQFTGTATFGTFTLTSTSNNINVFTAKLDSSNGNFLWAKSGVGPHTDRGLGIACDPTGNVYVTGQFTDTITFGVNHYSSLYDAIFLIKYDGIGNEQWFTMAGGGTYNIANGIAVDNSSNVYLTGDFTGTLTFFVSPPVTLTNKYNNRIFVAKYTSGGTLLWSTSDGSSNPVTSKAISLDNSGNAYIIGNFECIMNSYADQYGQGTFNTVGYWDIFTAEYSAAGTWQWSRQIGGHMNNYGFSLATSPTGDIYCAGSFDQDMIITDNPTNFIGYKTTPYEGCNTTYCSDPDYGDYQYFNTAGDLDIFIAKPIDLSRQPYDFYVRSGTACSRPFEGLCINPNCPDTVSACGFAGLTTITNTCPFIGPNFNYLWSNKQVASSITASSSGWYSVTATTVDGCFSSTDSIYVNIHPLPPTPNLSDNVIINTKSTSPLPIHICADSVKLWGGGYGKSTYYWSGGSTAKTDSIEAKSSGTYCFNIVDSLGCTSYVCVSVTLDSAFAKISPKLICTTCLNDTARFCKGGSFTMLAYDTVKNPTANPSICFPPTSTTVNKWGAKPAATISYSAETFCPDENNFIPSDSGWYQISDTIVQENLCDTIKTIVNDSVYVIVYPLPSIAPITITGNTSICPGDSTLIIAHDTGKFVWSNGSTKDSLWVKTGSYSISSSDTNKYGCIASASASISISYKTPPTILVTPSNGTICPGDSLELTCSGGMGTYSWYGPSGLLKNDTSSIYVKVPGYYYCVVSDSNYCSPVLSNTVLVNAYGTPFLSASPNNIICPGDTAHVIVNTSYGSVIEWQAPLSGSDTVQYITKAGTYSCKVISCGITTLASITVSVSNPLATITASGTKTFCAGDSVTLTGNTGMSIYDWTPGNVSSQAITVTKSGIYTLTTTDANGCTAMDTAHITVTPNNVSPPLAADTAACPGNSVELIATGGGTIEWFNSATASNPVGTGPVYNTPGIDSNTIFYVEVEEGGCQSKRIPVKVDTTDCEGIYIPNVFTPNGDGYNDVWYVTIKGATCFECNIYNRWGVLIYTLNSPTQGWNGIVRQTGEKASDGVYYYIINYCNYEGKHLKADGFIQLIRNK